MRQHPLLVRRARWTNAVHSLGVLTCALYVYALCARSYDRIFNFLVNFNAPALRCVHVTGALVNGSSSPLLFLLLLNLMIPRKDD